MSQVIGKIDVHAHFIPPAYPSFLSGHDYNPPDGMPGLPTWSPEAHLSFMDAQGISKAILSLSSPGVALVLDSTSTNSVCQDSNNYAASLKRAHPSRFGFFASLPLPDVASAIAEIHRVQKDLNADGFALLSNNLGVYLGDPSLRPVLSLLDTLNAVVFIHPTAPCSRDAGQHLLSPQQRFAASSPLAAHYRTPLFEFFFDSARSILDLVLSGTAQRFPRIRWIVSHCGGVLPSLLDRTCILPRTSRPLTMSRDQLSVSERDIRKFFREKCWYDLAGLPVPGQLKALLGMTGPERIFLGSDVPWTSFEDAAELMRDVEGSLEEIVGPEWVDAVQAGNARKLLGLGEGQAKQGGEQELEERR